MLRVASPAAAALCLGTPCGPRRRLHVREQQGRHRSAREGAAAGGGGRNLNASGRGLAGGAPSRVNRAECQRRPVGEVPLFGKRLLAGGRGLGVVATAWVAVVAVVSWGGNKELAEREEG